MLVLQEIVVSFPLPSSRMNTIAPKHVCIALESFLTLFTPKITASRLPKVHSYA